MANYGKNRKLIYVHEDFVKKINKLKIHNPELRTKNFVAITKIVDVRYDKRNMLQESFRKARRQFKIY